MVRKIAVFFAFVAFFLLALMYFTPKANIYFAIEHELKKRDVIISNESVIDNGFSLELQNAELFFKSVKSADIQTLNVKIFGIYNSLSMSGIELSPTASSFLPLSIESAVISHSLFNPLNVSIYQVGEAGEVKGSFNLLDMALHIIFEPSELMLKEYKNSMREFNKSKEGEYTYDKSF